MYLLFDKQNDIRGEIPELWEKSINICIKNHEHVLIRSFLYGCKSFNKCKKEAS